MPNSEVRLHDEAAAEYDAAFDWYLEHSPDSALKFDAEVERAFARLRGLPGAGCVALTERGGSCCGDFLF